MWQSALAGFSLGLLSSLHCIGMCGPLALALPVRHLSRMRRVMAMLLYNMGRVMTYSMMGLLLGWAGRGIYLAGFQQWFSILAGAGLLLWTLGRFSFIPVAQPAWLEAVYLRVQQLTGRYLQPKTLAAYLVPGLANGLLPCGMVYLAIAGAMSTRQVSHSIGLMFFFGVGTLPAMLALGLFGLRINLSLRRQFKKAIPWLATVMAVVLILRGLNLGIPMISPGLAANPGQAVSCHK